MNFVMKLNADDSLLFAAETKSHQQFDEKNWYGGFSSSPSARLQDGFIFFEDIFSIYFVSFVTFWLSPSFILLLVCVYMKPTKIAWERRQAWQWRKITLDEVNIFSFSNKPQRSVSDLWSKPCDEHFVAGGMNALH